MPKIRFNILFFLIVVAGCNGRDTFKEYYDTGELRYEYPIINGKRNGSYKMYYKDGSLMRDGEFSEGFLSGWNSFYYPNGRVQVKSHYDMYNGWQRLSRRIYYKENGDVISDLKFADKDISVNVLNKNEEYYVNDTLRLVLRINNPAYKFCEAVLGEFDENLNTLELPEKRPQTLYGSINHEIHIGLSLSKAGLDTLTFMVEDFDLIFNPDSTARKVGDMSFVGHVIDVKHSH